jgi:hypothetical protein
VNDTAHKATVTPLFVPSAVEAALRRELDALRHDHAELTRLFMRSNGTCQTQRLMLRALGRIVLAEAVDRLTALGIGVLLGLAAGEWLWP